MSQEQSRFVPSQQFTGMQIIDSKGAVVGNVKDVSVDFRKRALAFRITTKARSEIDVAWDDVLSVEDVVLLRKEVDLTVAATPSKPLPVVQAAVICASCGGAAPSHAKFCPKCGAALK